MSKFNGYIIFAFCQIIQISVYAKISEPSYSKQAFPISLFGYLSDTTLPKVNSFEVQKPKKWRHYKRGDTLYYCDVLKLRKINYKEQVFAVFGYSHIYQRKSRSKLKIKYVLKREAHYLSTIFYSKAVRLERTRVDKGYKAHMKILEKKYPSIIMWGVLDANVIGNVIVRK